MTHRFAVALDMAPPFFPTAGVSSLYKIKYIVSAKTPRYILFQIINIVSPAILLKGTQNIL